MEHTNIDDEIERLINLYGNDVLRVAYIYMKDKDLIEDIFQDVFVKIYKNYYKFNGKNSEKSWIMTITINTCKDYLRTAWIRKVITFDKTNDDLEYEISKDNRVEKEVLKTIESKEILNEISKLPSRFKEVILLFYYEELSIEEIGKALKVPEGTVKSRLHRARQMLKKYGGELEYER